MARRSPEHDPQHREAGWSYGKIKVFFVTALFVWAAAASARAQESATDLLGAIYWTHRGTGVYRAAPDGSEIKQLVDIENPDGLAIDTKGQKLYFTVSNYPAANADSIYRINLDGSGHEEVVGGLNFTGDMVLDPGPAKLYLTSVGGGTIFEIDIASKQRRDLVTGVNGPDELVLESKIASSISPAAANIDRAHRVGRHLAARHRRRTRHSLRDRPRSRR